MTTNKFRHVEPRLLWKKACLRLHRRGGYQAQNRFNSSKYSSNSALTPPKITLPHGKNQLYDVYQVVRHLRQP
jgi:hypothetical protein